MTLVLKLDPIFCQELINAIDRYQKSQLWLSDTTSVHCAVLKTMIQSQHYQNTPLPTTVALKKSMFDYLKQHGFKPNWASQHFGLKQFSHFRYRTLYYAIEDVCSQYSDEASLREFDDLTKKIKLVFVQPTSEGLSYKQNLPDLQDALLDWQAIYDELKEKQASNEKLLTQQTLLFEQIKQNNALIEQLKNELAKAKEEREQERMTFQAKLYEAEKQRQKDRDEFLARLEKLEKQAEPKAPEQKQDSDNDQAFFKNPKHKKWLKNKEPILPKNGHTNSPTLINKRGQLS